MCLSIRTSFSNRSETSDKPSDNSPITVARTDSFTLTNYIKRYGSDLISETHIADRKATSLPATYMYRHGLFNSALLTPRRYHRYAAMHSLSPLRLVEWPIGQTPPTFNGASALRQRLQMCTEANARWQRDLSKPRRRTFKQLLATESQVQVQVKSSSDNVSFVVRNLCVSISSSIHVTEMPTLTEVESGL